MAGPLAPLAPEGLAFGEGRMTEEEEEKSFEKGEGCKGARTGAKAAKRCGRRGCRIESSAKRRNQRAGEESEGPGRT